jgi:hypothetical protein
VFAMMRRKRRSEMMKDELGQSVDHLKRAATLAAQGTSATVGPKFSSARDRVQPVAGMAKGAASSSWGSTVATLTPLVTAASGSLLQAGKVSSKQAEENKKQAEANKKQAEANNKSAKKNAKKLQRSADRAVGRKQTGRKTSKLVGYALVGTALGAGAAFVLRRRKTGQWAEYAPTEPATSAPPAGGADDAAFEPVTEPMGASETVIAVAADPIEPAVAPEPDAMVTGDTADQTTSTQHSPTVARMASGKNKD